MSLVQLNYCIASVSYYLMSCNLQWRMSFDIEFSNGRCRFLSPVICKGSIQIAPLPKKYFLLQADMFKLLWTGWCMLENTVAGNCVLKGKNVAKDMFRLPWQWNFPQIRGKAEVSWGGIPLLLLQTVCEWSLQCKRFFSPPNFVCWNICGARWASRSVKLLILLDYC